MDKAKKTRVIKRYQNRKLYDTDHSCYVTLEDISSYIQQGEDVSVIDNKTQEDLTTLTLTQIILEDEKKKKNVLPLATLKNIIQSGGEQIALFFQKSIQTVSHPISNVKDEAERVIDLIKDEIGSGEDFIKSFLTKSHQGLDEITKKFEDKMKFLGKLTNTSFIRMEIRAVRKKLALLERKLRQFDHK